MICLNTKTQESIRADCALVLFREQEAAKKNFNIWGNASAEEMVQIGVSFLLFLSYHGLLGEVHRKFGMVTANPEEVRLRDESSYVPPERASA